MIQSMTGFGKASCDYENKKITVEIKSLNSKQADIATRIAPRYRQKDIELRNELAQALERGKIDLALYIDNSQQGASTCINPHVLTSYYEQINKISETTGIPLPFNWMETLLRLPEVMKSENEESNEEEWQVVKETLSRALSELKSFRRQEGKSLETVFRRNIAAIESLLKEIAPFEAERIDKIKSRLDENLQSLSEKIEYDSNRLEQELIFYIEKLDISEEKVRLSNHLRYFIETLESDPAPGKKLGFIAQEIGREINTLGSKANHSEIQKRVVQMKDELEQIKEQILNVL